MGSWHVQAQVPGQLKTGLGRPVPQAATPWPLSDGAGQLAVCRVNRRAGATGEAGMHPAEHKQRGVQGSPAPRVRPPRGQLGSGTAVRVSTRYLWRGVGRGALGFVHLQWLVCSLLAASGQAR